MGFASGSAGSIASQIEQLFRTRGTRLAAMEDIRQAENGLVIYSDRGEIYVGDFSPATAVKPGTLHRRVQAQELWSRREADRCSSGGLRLQAAYKRSVPPCRHGRLECSTRATGRDSLTRTASSRHLDGGGRYLEGGHPCDRAPLARQPRANRSGMR